MQMYETKKIGANKMTFEEFKEQATGLLTKISKFKNVIRLSSDIAVSWSIDKFSVMVTKYDTHLFKYYIDRLKHILELAEDYHEINGRG